MRPEKISLKSFKKFSDQKKNSLEKLPRKTPYFLIFKMSAITAASFQKVLDEYDGVVVYFTASWCGPCKKFSPLFKQYRADNKNTKIKFVKIDVSRSEAEDKIADSYAVESLPKVIIFVDGKIVDSLEKLSIDKFKDKFINKCDKLSRSLD